MNARRFSILAVALVLAIAAAVAKTKVVDTSADAAKLPPPKEILVRAVAADPLTRAAFEDVIAGELALRGAAAVASHTDFPELPKERGPFEAKLKELGFDALTIS